MIAANVEIHLLNKLNKQLAHVYVNNTFLCEIIFKAYKIVVNACEHEKSPKYVSLAQCVRVGSLVSCTCSHYFQTVILLIYSYNCRLITVIITFYHLGWSWYRLFK